MKADVNNNLEFCEKCGISQKNRITIFHEGLCFFCDGMKKSCKNNQSQLKKE